MADQPWLDPDEQAAWRSYLQMRRTLHGYLARQLQAEFGLSDSDFEILVNLSESPTGRMRAYELGQLTQWEKSRMSRHLSRMESRGLVRREANDARYPDIVLTDAGLAAIKASAPANAARIRDLFIDVLGPDRLATLRQAADDVVAAVERLES
jgi:DNA-binding MarR family transcriptional regulator